MDQSTRFCPAIQWEIGTADPEPLRRFYREAFGWKMHIVSPAAYTMIASKGESGLGGGFADTRGGFPDYVTVYVEVDDVTACMDRAASCGGKKLMGPFQAAETLTVGFVTDPDEIMVGLMHFSGPIQIPPGFLDGPVACPVAGFEVRSRNVARSVAFYQDLFGWTVKFHPAACEAKASAVFPAGPKVEFFTVGEGDLPGIRFVVQTPDLTVTAGLVIRCGGNLLPAQTGLPPGTAVVFADPGGHVAGMTSG
jgi:predicted enzyme related to lactoylglutathione lyase